YEMTPEGLKREEDVDRSQPVTSGTGHKINVLIVVMLALAIAAVAVDRLIPEKTPVAGEPAVEGVGEAPPATSGGDTQTTAAGQVPEASIAVLPFENFSGNEEDAYFSDGLSDTVLHQLAQIPDLKVIARNSSFQFKGTNLDVREVGDRLGVGNVLEGSVQRQGDQVRVIAQLVRTSDGSHVWSQTFDYRMDDIFAMHDAIALAVAEQMKLSLLPEDAASIDLGGTDNAEAYDLFLQAWGAFYATFNPAVADRVDPDDDYPPMEMLDRTLLLDPDYVDAIIAKVDIYNMFAFQATSIEKMQRYMAKAQPLADRALELAPEYSGAWRAKGAVAHRTGNTDEALAAYRKAIALNPNDAQAHQGLAVASLGVDPLATIEHMRIARELDPENPFNRPTVLALATLGRNKEAIELLKSDLTGMSGLDQIIYDDLADIYLFALGRPDEAARWASKLLSLESDSIRGTIAMVRVWIAVGDLDRAARWLAAVTETGRSSDSVSFYRVNLAIAQGDMAAASEALQSISSGRGKVGGPALENKARLCIVEADYGCAYSAAIGFGQSLDQFEARGRAWPVARATQQLFLAVVAARTRETPDEPAQAVIEITSTLPRAGMSGQGSYYMDAEAFVLQGKDTLALHALEESLLGDQGFVPWDSFRRLPDDGIVLSELDGNPQFEDWKTRFRERREAARANMVEMEELGEIPAPPSGST
ncbi:MAG: tetratricopeptide repeat protein, partial [Gammaproteobacteria bacterium]